MTTLLKVGQSGRASFYDGVFSEPPTVQQSAARAGATAGGRVLIGTHEKAAGAKYDVLHEAGRLNIYETRAGSATSDGIAAEHDKLRAINAANAAFWGRPAPKKAKP